MKKLFLMCVWMGVLVVAVGCSEKEIYTETYESVKEIQEEYHETVETKSQVETSISEEEGIIDISTYGKNMAYAEMYNIYGHLDDEIGKTLKVQGIFKYLETDTPVYLCIITDQLGCCGIPIQFEPAEGYIFPNDFPEMETTFILSGTIEKKRNDKGFDELILQNAEIRK